MSQLAKLVIVALFAAAPVRAQMVCGAEDAEHLQKLQSTSGEVTDLANSLLVAVTRQQARSALWLLDKGASAESRDAEGLTALMYLVLGADEGPEDPDVTEPLPPGVTEEPWPCTAERREAEREILEALVKRSPDLDARSSKGFTALIQAAQRRRFDLVFKLRDAGANINAANHVGWTAIFFAPRALLKPMVKAGANIDAATTKGNTILHLKIEKLRGQRMLDFVDTAIKLGAHDSRNVDGNWASEMYVDPFPFFDMPGGLGNIDAMRKRLKATRPAP